MNQKPVPDIKTGAIVCGHGVDYDATGVGGLIIHRSNVRMRGKYENASS